MTDRRPRVVSPSPFSRRSFIRGAVSAIAGVGASALLGCGDRKDSDPIPVSGSEPPPEITTIKLIRTYDLCAAPMYLAKEFLFEEGFTDVQYLPVGRRSEIVPAIIDGYVDMAINFAPAFTAAADAGRPITALGGMHVGCWVIFARPGITSIGELTGKTVGIAQSHAVPADFDYWAMLLGALKVSVSRDIELKAFPRHELVNALVNGYVDALLVSPPESQLLNTIDTGTVIVNSNIDAPWSNYVCCIIGARSEFIQKYPVATKRTLRALYRAADFCATQPQAAAQRLVDDGFAVNFDYALETVSMGKYGIWRDYDPEEALRFYALRLKEEGLVKAVPQAIIDRHTDWRFLERLKNEMAFAPAAYDPAAYAISCGEAPPGNRLVYGTG